MAGKGKDEDDDEGNGGSGGGGSSTPAQAFPAFMPGQADMLAQQIGMGFGQDPAAVLAYLNQIYKPVQMPGAGSGSGGDSSDSGGGSGGDGRPDLDAWRDHIEGSDSKFAQFLKSRYG